MTNINKTIEDIRRLNRIKQAESVKRKRDRGLTKVCVWIHRDNADILRTVATSLEQPPKDK